MDKCQRCGGVAYLIVPNTTGDFQCYCPAGPKLPQQHLMGWECPRCHTIHSPYSVTCSCPPDYFEYTGITTNIEGHPTDC